jgi:hypothetical protein
VAQEVLGLNAEILGHGDNAGDVRCAGGVDVAGVGLRSLFFCGGSGLLGAECSGSEQEKEGGVVRLGVNQTDGVHGVFPSMKSNMLGGRTCVGSSTRPR